MKTGWGITTGEAGHTQQVLGMLELLVDEPRMITVRSSGLAKYFAPRWPVKLPNEMSAAFPDIAISAGRKSAAYLHAVSKASNGDTFTTALQNPTAPTNWFDLIWVNDHDTLGGANVIKTLTSPHRVTSERMKADGEALKDRLTGLRAPYIGVLLGGPNKAYSMPGEHMRRLGSQTAKLAQSRGATILITPSRRTGNDVVKHFIEGLGEIPSWCWAEPDPNPYFGLLGIAGEIVVTCDSVNMMGEACVTGKPVHIAKLPGHGPKFAKFHDALIAKGAARWLSEEPPQPWHYEPINSNDYIVSEIVSRYEAKTRARERTSQ